MHDDEPSDRDEPSDPSKPDTTPPEPAGPDSGATPPESISEEEEFARMMEESLAPKSYREGETVSGTIVAVGADVAFFFRRSTSAE